MTNYYSINDVIKQTGFNKRTVNDLLQHIRVTIKPYSKRGSYNRWQFDSTGMDIWDKVRQLKDDGLGNKVIGEELAKLYVKQPEKSPKQDVKPSENDLVRELMDKLERSNENTFGALKEISEKEKMISEKEKLIAVQQQQLLLLTEGKTPEEMKREKQDQEKELIIRQEKRKLLLGELLSLEGKWFKNSRKKEIISELQEMA